MDPLAFTLPRGEEIAPSVMCFAAWLASVALWRGLDRQEWRYVWASFAMHAICTIAIVQWSEVSQGGGDMIGYIYHGRILSRMMRLEPSLAVPVVLRALFHDPNIDLITSAGTTTGSMKALCGLCMLAAFDSTYACSFVLTALSFHAKVAMYCVFRDTLPPHLQGRAATAALLIPSSVFWSCGIVKETVAMTGLGWLLFGMHRLSRGHALLGLAIVAVSGTYAGLIKPYVLFPFAVAGLAYLRAIRGRGSGGSMGGLLVVGAGAILAIALLGKLFPQYGVDNVSEEARMSQVNASALVEASSNYSLGEIPETPGGQAARAPLALFTALFRPFPFEATGMTSLVCALETAMLLAMALRALRRRSPTETWRALRGSPILTFAGFFTVLFGTAVGLSTLNFGTLSRYRVPLMPFYSLIILVLDLPPDWRQLGDRRPRSRQAPGDRVEAWIHRNARRASRRSPRAS